MSIPALIRKQLGLSKNSKAIISVKEGKMLVEPVKDLLELRGSIKSNKNSLSNQELDEFVGTAVVEEYTQKLKNLK